MSLVNQFIGTWPQFHLPTQGASMSLLSLCPSWVLWFLTLAPLLSGAGCFHPVSVFLSLFCWVPGPSSRPLRLHCSLYPAQASHATLGPPISPISPKLVHQFNYNIWINLLALTQILTGFEPQTSAPLLIPNISPYPESYTTASQQLSTCMLRVVQVSLKAFTLAFTYHRMIAEVWTINAEQLLYVKSLPHLTLLLPFLSISKAL